MAIGAAAVGAEVNEEPDDHQQPPEAAYAGERAVGDGVHECGEGQEDEPQERQQEAVKGPPYW